MNCKKCGATTAARDNFCGSCGEDFSEAKSRKSVVRFLAPVTILAFMISGSAFFFLGTDIGRGLSAPVWNSITSQKVSSGPAEFFEQADLGEEKLFFIANISEALGYCPTLELAEQSAPLFEEIVQSISSGSEADRNFSTEQVELGCYVLPSPGADEVFMLKIVDERETGPGRLSKVGYFVLADKNGDRYYLPRYTSVFETLGLPEPYKIGKSLGGGEFDKIATTIGDQL